MNEFCEPFATLNRLIDMRIHDPVSRAYRTTFGEYARKLEALQRLLESKGSDNGGVEAALQDVETARQAYHSARDVLAGELGLKPRCRTAEAAVR